MMLELGYLSLLPVPVLLAIVGSVIVSVIVFIQSCLDVITCRGQIPELYYRESSLNDHVLEKCKMKDRMFEPSFWFRCKHVQTCLPVILPRPDVTFEREYLQMADKGVVALDWVITPHIKVKRKTPILLVLPSMTEGAVSVSAVCSLAVGRGMKPLVFNRRGFGGSHLTTPKLTSPGDPSDLRQVVIYLKQRMPKSPLAVIAYGSGCGLMLSYLGEFGSSALVSVAVCISPTFDEPARFSSQFQSPYDLLLLLRLKSIITCRHLPALNSVIDVEGLLSSWTFDGLNQSVFSAFPNASQFATNASSSNPMTNSFSTVASSVDQFWESNNSMRDVDDIAVPIMCIRSLDDPINPSSEIPYDLFKCYPNFLLVVTERGGHCGFLEGIPPISWSDCLSLDYVEAVLDFTTKTQSLLPSSSISSKPSSAPIFRSRYHSISGVGGFDRRASNLFFQGYRHGSDGSNYRRKSSSARGSFGSGVYSQLTETIETSIDHDGSGGSGLRKGSYSRGSNDSLTGSCRGSGVNDGSGGGGDGASCKTNGGAPILLRRLSSLSSRSKSQRSTL